MTTVPSIDVHVAAQSSTELLLDVREYHEFMAGHVQGSVHVPMGDLPARVGELDVSRRIICICRSGNRSAQVTQWLVAQGFDAVNLTGGVTAWTAAGLPLVNHNGHPGTVA